MLTRYVLTVLVSLLPATASVQVATLTAEPAVARPGGSIRLAGTGFDACRDADTPDRRIEIASDRPGIATLSFRGTPGGTFNVDTSVSDDPAPGEHTITASCGAEGPTATTTVTIEVADAPATTVPRTGDGDDPSTVGPTTAGADPPTARTPTAPQAVASAATARWPLVGLALALVTLIGIGIRRLLAARSPVVDVRTVPGVVVGPRARRSTSRRDGVRVATHADPGTRTVTIRPPAGGRPS